MSTFLENEHAKWMRYKFMKNQRTNPLLFLYIKKFTLPPPKWDCKFKKESLMTNRIFFLIHCYAFWDTCLLHKHLSIIRSMFIVHCISDCNFGREANEVMIL